MEKSSRVALVLAVVFLLIGGIFYIANDIPDKTPEALIQESLADAQKAAQRGDVGGIMDIVSDDFRSGAWNRTTLRLLLARTLRDSRGMDYSVRVNAPKIQPSPNGRLDERLVLTQFAAFSPQTGDDYYKSKGGVMLIMRAEKRRRLLFFTEPRWRIVSILNMAALPFSDENSMGDTQ